jgi:hypothetical protein
MNEMRLAGMLLFCLCVPGYPAQNDALPKFGDRSGELNKEAGTDAGRD